MSCDWVDLSCSFLLLLSWCLGKDYKGRLSQDWSAVISWVLPVSCQCAWINMRFKIRDQLRVCRSSGMMTCTVLNQRKIIKTDDRTYHFTNVPECSLEWENAVKNTSSTHPSSTHMLHTRHIFLFLNLLFGNAIKVWLTKAQCWSGSSDLISGTRRSVKSFDPKGLPSTNSILAVNFTLFQTKF